MSGFNSPISPKGEIKRAPHSIGNKTGHSNGRTYRIENSSNWRLIGKNIPTLSPIAKNPPNTTLKGKVNTSPPTSRFTLAPLNFSSNCAHSRYQHVQPASYQPRKTPKSLNTSVEAFKKLIGKSDATDFDKNLQKVCKSLKGYIGANDFNNHFETKNVGADTLYLLPSTQLGKGASNAQFIAVNLDTSTLYACSERQDHSSSPVALAPGSPISPLSTSSINTAYTTHTSEPSSELSLNFDFLTESSSPVSSDLSIEVDEISLEESPSLLPQERINQYLSEENTNAAEHNLLETKVIRNDGLITKISKFCRGGDAKGYVSKETDPNKLLTVATGLLKGLSFLHSKNFVHRDIKLENLLIDLDHDNNPQVYISDFDSALPSDEHQEMALARNHKGLSLANAAPELLIEDSVDTHVGVSSDLYAAGIVLAQIATKIQSPHITDSNKLLPAIIQKRQNILNEAIFGDLAEEYQELPLNNSSSPLMRLAAQLMSIQPDNRGNAIGALYQLEKLNQSF